MKNLGLFLGLLAVSVGVYVMSAALSTEPSNTTTPAIQKRTEEPQTQEQIQAEAKLQAEALERNRAVAARGKAAAQKKALSRALDTNKLNAFTMAQDFVESSLLCPRTAKWPWISYSKVTFHLGDGKYQISSYLDAQNGFGAMVRVNFICVVEHVGGSRWRLVKLAI